jgi:hypothetical protein
VKKVPWEESEDDPDDTPEIIESEKSEDDPDDPPEIRESLVCGEANDLFTSDEFANKSRPNKENTRSIRIDSTGLMLKFVISM